MNSTDDNRPAFARGTTMARLTEVKTQLDGHPRAEPTTELRGECPRTIVDVLDAISMARGFPTRTALVNQILGEWADKVLHEHSVLQRVVGFNPAGPDSHGGTHQ